MKKKKKRDKPKGRTMVWSKHKASEKEEAVVEKKRHKIRSKIFQFFSRLGPSFSIAKRMRKAPGEAPVLNGVVKGSNSITSEISKESEIREAKGIPSVSKALKIAKIGEGNSLLSKIKISVLSPFKLIFKKKVRTRAVSNSVGKRAETPTNLHRGRLWGWKIPKGKPIDIHLPATIRAAAIKQKYRKTPLETSLKISIEDVREKTRKYKAPMTLVFVIDLSGSMLFSIEESKEALLRLHRDAYCYRDKVGIVALKDTRAVVVQHPITNLGVVANKLLGLRISGSTPLAAGMLKAQQVLKETRLRNKATIPVMVIITDGNANVPLYRSLKTGKYRNFDEVGITLRKFEDLAVKDVVSVSKMIKKEGIYTSVVNTNPHYSGKETYGSLVTKIISSITEGSHHQISKFSYGKERVDEIFVSINSDQQKIAQKLPISQTDLWDIT
ncbi:MAG: VWA domain-containing protein [Candidatus Hermodarchaeota archaeon]